jgi:radical SAM superfamily enzyme YgiQ (UPF0313 family)
MPNAPASLNVLLVYPRFPSLTFWNYRATCELSGARYPAAPLGLITVAAMLPAHWNLRLVDRNTEELSEADMAWADIVMTGGMLPQQLDTLELIEMCEIRDKPVAVGGPDISSSPHVYADADFRIVGEAEDVIGDFVAALERKDTGGVFEAERYQVDITASPIPRFDLLKFENYLHVGIQFSRGCPFTCEFCDIIELYGRVPRAKTDAQMLAELDALYECGYRGWIDFVDDNMIGNKKALKRFLPKLAEWQEQRGYPFEFSTEASINLADHEELLQLMRRANFFAIFVGIETPDAETLIAASKKQNTRRDLAASVHGIYRAGIFVTAGFIVGFDGEKASVAKPITALIEAAAIPVCMVGLLHALPNTQLTRRLMREGRLHPNHDVTLDEECDQCTVGLNFDTTRPRHEILRDCKDIVETIYAPAAYFSRVRNVGLMLNCSKHRNPYPLGRNLRELAAIIWRLTCTKGVARHFWRTAIDCAVRNPSAVRSVIKMSALYLHLSPFSKYVCETLERHIEEPTSRWQRLRPLRERPAPKVNGIGLVSEIRTIHEVR